MDTFEEKRKLPGINEGLGLPPYGMRITGVGGYVPEKIVTNDELAENMRKRAAALKGLPPEARKATETSDEWIRERTGIEARRYAAQDQATSDLALKAAEEALETAGLDRNCLDFIIFARVTPDYLYSPPTSAVLARKLGLKGVELNADLKPQAIRRPLFVYDTDAACTSFGAALFQAYGLIRSGLHRKGLIVGADIVETIANPLDRSMIVLFGSAAGAFVVEAVPENQDSFRPEWFSSGAEGRLSDKIICRVGGTAEPLTLEIMRQIVEEPWSRPDKIWQDGGFILKFMVKFVADLLLPQVVAKAGLGWEEIKHIFFHMANGRLIEAAANRARQKLQAKGIKHFPLVHNTIAQFANTTSATLPLGLRAVLANDWEKEILAAAQSREANLTLKEGDIILFCAFGGGLTWTTAFCRWTGVNSLPLAYLGQLQAACSK